MKIMENIFILTSQIFLKISIRKVNPTLTA